MQAVSDVSRDWFEQWKRLLKESIVEQVKKMDPPVCVVS